MTRGVKTREERSLEEAAPSEGGGEDMLLEPYRYLVSQPGKNIRVKLLDAFNEWMRVDSGPLRAVQQLVQKLHNASLLIDDIEDGSQLRRGQPAAHMVYGIPHVINTANYVYFQALDDVVKLQSGRAVAVFTEEVLRLHNGQGHDIYWRDRNQCPTEAEYRRMVLNKTGGLFRLAVRMMQCFSDDTCDYVPLVDKLGLYFQIRDDLVNLRSTDFMASKGFCEDLTEGKFSFPVIHAIRANPDDHRLLSILKMRTSDVDIKSHAVAYMRSVGSFSYTFQVLDHLYTDILSTLNSMPPNPSLSNIVNYLHHSILELGKDFLELSKDSLKLSKDSLELSKDSLELSKDSLELSKDSLELSKYSKPNSLGLHYVTNDRVVM